MDKEAALRKLRESDLTDFQKRVLVATAKIPKGQTRTYKQIAAAVGHPNAYRAVGSALKRNPLAPMIPCHRVIKSSGDLGNYSGVGGRHGKMLMLKKEGAIRSGP
jgi:methylated-DNA-[protein]-cysteine S-methyltransferase